MPFTGQSVRVLREALRLAPQQFASLVGVSPSTISRWELAGKDMLRPEPLQLQLLTVIEQELGKRPTAERRSTRSVGPCLSAAACWRCTGCSTRRSA
jgi:transcriptional regulator with XRE-family HTH domain